MKNYYFFPDEGAVIKFEDERGQIALSIEGEYKPRFSPEKLIKQLKELTTYLERFQPKPPRNKLNDPQNSLACMKLIRQLNERNKEEWDKLSVDHGAPDQK